MSERSPLTDDQAATLDRLVREKRPWLLSLGADVRLWGPSHDGSRYEIRYRGHVDPTAEMIEPFQVFGPGAVRLIRTRFMYDPTATRDDHTRPQDDDPPVRGRLA